MKLPEHVLITDVTCRDGMQSAARVYTVEEKLKVIHMLEDAGCRSIEVGAFAESFPSMYKMANTKEVFRALEQKEGILYRGLVFSADEVEAAADAGCRKVRVFISASPKHYAAGSEGKTIRQGMAEFEKCGQKARQYGQEITGAISIPFLSPFPGEGLIPIETVKEIARAMADAGFSEISLSDATGTAFPELVYARVCEMMDCFPQVDWMVHLHDTYGMGMANTLAALQAGVTKMDASLAGLGGCPFVKGAAGNISTEDLVYMLNGMDIETGWDLKKTIEAGNFVFALTEGAGTNSAIHAVNEKSHLWV